MIHTLFVPNYAKWRPFLATLHAQFQNGGVIMQLLFTEVLPYIFFIRFHAPFNIKSVKKSNFPKKSVQQQERSCSRAFMLKSVRSMQKHYKILGLARNRSIKRAFRLMSVQPEGVHCILFTFIS